MSKRKEPPPETSTEKESDKMIIEKKERKPWLILSFDIEADGPAPGLHSMISLGVAGITLEGKIVFKWEKNLKPLEGATQDENTMKWWAKEENREAWEYCNKNQEDPATAMKDLNEKILELMQKWDLITCAAPAGYDYQFPNWYFVKFVGENPLGHKAHCMNSYLWAMKGEIHPSIYDFRKQFLHPDFPHTHKALDDALEQGMMFLNALLKNTSKNK